MTLYTMILKEKLSNADKVIKEAKSLRSLQKTFFKTRDYEVLKKCKIQERKVDAMIDQFLGISKMQGKLW